MNKKKKEKDFHFIKKELIKDEPIINDSKDLFNLKESINSFWNYINSYDTPLVVGIFDKWGSGKSSFLRLVNNKNPKNFLIFEAWKYKEKKDLWKALTLEMCKKWNPKDYEKLREDYYFQKTKQVLNKFNIINLLILILFLIVIIFIYQILVKDSSITTILSFIAIMTFILSYVNLISSNSTKRPIISYEQYEEAYQRIIENNKSKKYIIIEDLDRCFPKDAINLLEDLKGFFKIKNSEIVFILPIDSVLLEKEIQRRYDNKEIKINDYLNRIIDIPYYLPSKEQHYKNYINKILSRIGKNRLETDFGKIKKFTINIEEFLDYIFRITNNNNPRKIKKILLDLDLAFHLITNKDEINSIKLLIIILIRNQYIIGYEILIRLVNLDSYKEQNCNINKENFLYSNQNQELTFYDLANQIKILNHVGNNSENTKLKFNYDKISLFNYFISTINTKVNNVNQKDLFIPKNIEKLKFYINSIELITKKKTMSGKELAEEIMIAEMEAEENKEF